MISQPRDDRENIIRERFQSYIAPIAPAVSATALVEHERCDSSSNQFIRMKTYAAIGPTHAPGTLKENRQGKRPVSWRENQITDHIDAVALPAKFVVTGYRRT